MLRVGRAVVGLLAVLLAGCQRVSFHVKCSDGTTIFAHHEYFTQPTIDEVAASRSKVEAACK